MALLPVLLAAAAAMPIPGMPDASAPSYSGAPATPKVVHSPPSPRHPAMAPNGDSNLHEDGWQTDASHRAGPLGKDPQTFSTYFMRECASVTFDSRGRIVTVCVGLDKPVLEVLDPKTLDTIASMDLPPRPMSSTPFSSFGGGGYFYLDAHDRAVIPTGNRHIYVVHVGASDLTLEKDLSLESTVKDGDSIVSALPDWAGRLWFASRSGLLGTVNRTTGETHAVQLEPIGNSFAVSETGGVYVVTDGALYRYSAADDGVPQRAWRVPYDNTGVQKPGQTQAGSGTTPTLSARKLVAITDNADPMNVVVFTRSGRQVCKQPVFEKGASDTDQSLIAAGRSFVVENNYGYSGPAATEGGKTSTPGLERVDVARDLKSCRKVWHSDEIAPSVVPKLSVPNGLVYTYTKPAGFTGDPWYFTALDFRTGKTVYKTQVGAGLGFNNNYAPVTIGADGTAYVGTLGGLVGVRDVAPPTQPASPPAPRLKLVLRCHRSPVLRGDTDWIVYRTFTRHGRRVVARIRLTDERVVRRSAPRPRCLG
jgi:outer membrane protein assembly factor BamB